jgi:hypothetical protein
MEGFQGFGAIFYEYSWHSCGNGVQRRRGVASIPPAGPQNSFYWW